MPEFREFLTVPEAGSAIGVKPSRAYAMAAQGLIPTLKLGRRLLVPRRALAAMADAAIERGRALGAGTEPLGERPSRGR